MKGNRLLGALLATGLGLAAFSHPGLAEAQGKGKPKKETPAAPAAEPPMTTKPVALTPAGVVWGMSVKQVHDVVDKMIDEAYKPLYKTTSPGVKMKALDAQVAEEKSTFRRSRVDFGKLPTGIDATPLKGEYSYLNKEFMLSLTRDGRTRHFFFIQDKLWKMIEEIKLGEGSPYGKDFTEATVKLTKLFGVPGRVLPADFEKGRPSVEVDWKDSMTHIRAIMRSETAFALAFEDLGTLGSLASLRVNKPVDDSGIDPAVASALAKGSAPPGPPEDPKAKPKGKK